MLYKERESEILQNCKLKASRFSLKSFLFDIFKPMATVKGALLEKLKELPFLRPHKVYQARSLCDLQIADENL
jgi:predicted DNA-binding helix-hairpin-helix protein